MLVVAKDQADDVVAHLTASGEDARVIGELTKGTGAKTQAKGKGTAEAVALSGDLAFATS